jgi:hypothetical protein
VPDLSISEKNLDCWRSTEQAKHYLVYNLLRFGLPVTRRWIRLTLVDAPREVADTIRTTAKCGAICRRLDD